MLISEKDNGGSKTEESNDAGKDNVCFLVRCIVPAFRPLLTTS